MVTKPIWPNGRFGVPQITPYTYRDGQSLLELIKALRDHVVEQLHPSLQHAIDQLVADVESEYEKAHDRYVDGVQEFQRIHDAFMSDVNASLVALNDTAVSDLVDDETSLLGSKIRDMFVSRQDRVFSPSELTFESLQQACDDAHEHDGIVWAAGDLYTDQTLVVRSAADLSNLTIHYTGTGIAVQVGEVHTRLIRKDLALPHVICINKPPVGWTPNTVGYRLMSLSECFVKVPYARDFETGLLEGGHHGFGHCYNNVFIGSLMNNKVNQHLETDPTGWTNENNYYGGRFSQFSSEGQPATGANHIYLDSDSSSTPNNNRWYGASLEGNACEYHINVERGNTNRFIQCRFERGGSVPPVRWGPSAWNNIIDGGLEAQRITETFVNGSMNNTILHPHGNRERAILRNGHMYESSAGTGQPIFTFLETQAGQRGHDPQTQYTARFSASSIIGKNSADDSYRHRIDFYNGNSYQTGFHQLDHVLSAPNNGPDGARLFSRVVNGKTQLCVRFPTGGVKIISSED